MRGSGWVVGLWPSQGVSERKVLLEWLIKDGSINDDSNNKVEMNDNGNNSSNNNTKK